MENRIIERSVKSRKFVGHRVLVGEKGQILETCADDIFTKLNLYIIYM